MARTSRQIREEQAKINRARNGQRLDRSAMDRTPVVDAEPPPPPIADSEETLRKDFSSLSIEPGGPQPDEPKKKPRVRIPEKASEKVQSFLGKYGKKLVRLLLGCEAPPENTTESCSKCPNCLEDQKINNTFYRCPHCPHLPPVCDSCIKATHVYNPLHLIERWDSTKKFWQWDNLQNLDMHVILCKQGAKCPSLAKELRAMTVISIQGIQKANFQFCRCAPPKVEGEDISDVRDVNQLVSCGYWPATYERPKTVFTMDLMELFQQLWNTANVNANDFITVLRRRTDDIEPDSLPDHRREFIASVRNYHFAMLCKRKGVDPTEELPCGCLAVLCPACPHPGINMPEGWEFTPDELSFIHSLVYAIDGNFHQNLKDKKTDGTDYSLGTGAAYYANEDHFNSWLEFKGEPEKEVTTCSQFATLSYSSYEKKVSGTIGLSCSRQMFVLPAGTVDLQKGERYANVNFARMYCLQRWKKLKQHVASYDIMCQFAILLLLRVNVLVEWFKATWNGVVSALPEGLVTIFAVPKFHLIGHQLKCRYKFSFNWLPGVGMTDGEAPERIWSSLNALGQRTREMSPGHRHDVINEFCSDMNWRRTQKLAKSTRTKFDDAVQHSIQIAQELQELEEGIKKSFKNCLDVWKEEEAEFKRKVVDITEHATLENPYELKKEKGLTEDDSLGPLQSSEDQKTEVSTKLYSLIQEGLSLEKDRQSCLRAMDDNEKTNAINTRYDHLKARYDAWRSLYDEHVLPLIDEAAAAASEPVTTAPDASLEAPTASVSHKVDAEPPKSGSGENSTASSKKTKKRKKPDDDTIATSEAYEKVNAFEFPLPSSYSTTVQQHSAVTAAAKTELRLRKVQALEALDNLRSQIITKYQFQKDIDKIPNSQRTITRKVAKSLTKQRSVEDAAKEYTSIRDAMIKLGLSEKDKKFRPLLASDLKPFTISDVDRKPGESRNRKATSWIWEDLSFAKNADNGKIAEYYKDVIRVLWFCTSALRTRWWEEKKIVKAEMVRQVLFHMFYKNKWETDAERQEKEGMLETAAYSRKQANVYERLLNGCRKAFEGTDVELPK